MSERVLVTGGLGFIGSAFIRQATARGEEVLNVDLHTYAADERRLDALFPGHVETVRLDVADPALIGLVAGEAPQRIVHFAAESHVTRGERDAAAFFHSNVDGTHRLLEAAERADVELVVHVSTDEVYGPCWAEPFRETDKLPGEGQATSAYARSKAVADDLALSFRERIPLVVIRPTNCFGPWQHPEKAIPRWTARALLGEPLPVWGDGGYVRDWMFVEDACTGIQAAIERGTPGEVYNLGPQGEQLPNVEIARIIARAAGRSDDVVYLTDYDRPRHDRRYAIDASKIRALGWHPTGSLTERLAETVDWYETHRTWWIPSLLEAEDLYADAAWRRDQRRTAV